MSVKIISSEVIPTEDIKEAVDFLSKKIDNISVKLKKETSSDKDDLLKTYAILAERFFSGKFISPTIFEKDKKLISNIIYLPKAYHFSMTVRDVDTRSRTFLHFDFYQLQELIEIGAIQEDETNLVDNCYFIVK